MQLLYKGWDRERVALTPWFVLLRASAIYQAGYKHASLRASKDKKAPLTFVWKVAGPALCELKARQRSYGKASQGRRAMQGPSLLQGQPKYGLASIRAIVAAMGQETFDSDDEPDDFDVGGA